MADTTDQDTRRLEYAMVATIPGWMSNVDFRAFKFVLSAQLATEPPGALAEVGAYKGKSAVVIGGWRRAGEPFTVVDLFEDGAETDHENSRENARSYGGASQRQFEVNYLSVHSALPNIVKGPSTGILEHAPHHAHRFVHVDASHLYGHVREDIAAAKVLLRPDGVLVLDDYRSPHTPGVAAATWSAVDQGLRPFLLTTSKFYGTWGDTSRWATALSSWLAGSDLEHEVQSIAGHDVYRVWPRSSAISRWVPPAAVPLARILRMRILSQRGRA